MEYVEHGGNCCGASHVYNFSHVVDEREILFLDEAIRNAIETVEEGALDNCPWDEDTDQPIVPWKKFGHLIEVVLTDQQMVNWAATLKAKGFKLHRRWKNDNSGNYCNLLSYIPKEP